MHGAKTGNSKDLQQIEEARIRIQKTVEDREIPLKDDMMEMAGEMENRMPENRQHIKDLIKCYWVHTARVH